MRRLSRFLLCLCALGAIGPIVAAETAPGVKHDSVLEVERMKVDRENYSTKELERAGKIPDEALDGIQRALIGIATRAGRFQGVRKPAEGAAPGEAVVVLGGRVTDYKEGNRAARLLVGMGAGAQKFEAECVLTDKATGKVLGKERIADKKWGGIAGGNEEKGLEDFSEKVLAFVDRSLAAK